MAERITAEQYSTLSIIAQTGRTFLLPEHWRNRHYQSLLRRGLLRLRADPFKTKALMLFGSITKRGREAVAGAPQSIRDRAKALQDQDYLDYRAAIERGEIEP